MSSVRRTRDNGKEPDLAGTRVSEEKEGQLFLLTRSPLDIP